MKQVIVTLQGKSPYSQSKHHDSPQELSDLIGRNVQREGRHNLATARKQLFGKTLELFK